MRSIASIIDVLALIAGYLAGAAVLAMTGLVTLDVALRFITGRGTRMAVEVSGYLLVAIVFLGLAYTQREKGHIRIDLFVQMLPARLRLWVTAAGSLVFLTYALFLGYRNWHTVAASYQFKTTSRTGLDVTVWPLQALIPLGLLILALVLIVETMRTLRHIINNDSGSNGDQV